MEKVETIKVTLTIKEASMIYKLRKYDFGQFTIHKMNGDPVRIIIGGSEALQDEDAIKLLREENGIRKKGRKE